MICKYQFLPPAKGVEMCSVSSVRM